MKIFYFVRNIFSSLSGDQLCSCFSTDFFLFSWTFALTILSLASVLGFDCKTCRSISLNMNKEGESSIEMIHKSPEHGTLMELPGRKTSLTSYLYSPISHSDNFQTTVAHDHIFVLNDALWSNLWLANFRLMHSDKFEKIAQRFAHLLFVMWLNW